MTDYDLLLSLLDMYRSKLEKRKNGVQLECYDFQTGKTRREACVPSNKARLNRLRIEIAAMMLKIEKQMTETCNGKPGKESWCNWTF